MLSLVLRRAALAFGESTMVRASGRTYSFREVESRVARIAAAIVACGLMRGDRVAILCGNRMEYIELYFAVSWAGGVLVPLNNRSHPAEMAFWLADSGAKILLLDCAYRDLLTQLRDAVPHEFPKVIEIGGNGPGSYEDAIASSEPMEPVVAEMQDLAAIFYTGGTMGRSKGVMLSHGNLLTNALQYVRENGYERDTVFLHAAPMFHLADGASDFALTMAGSQHCFLPAFEVESLLATIEREMVTNVVLVPTMVQRMLEYDRIGDFDLSSLKLIGYGAAPMPEPVLREAMRVLPVCGFLQAYGMTELSPVATVLQQEYHCLDGPYAGKLKSAGRPTLAVEVRVADEDGNILLPGEIGEVIVRGPTVMMGYWNLPKETAEAIRDGWMRTGDAGRFDDEGFLYIEDRIKDMIISGGENIYPAEVEAALLDHPDIAHCAVIGLPSEKWGEQVHAVVVPTGGAQLEESAVIAFSRERLTSYKCPKSVTFMDELPLTGAGKVQKNLLRERALSAAHA